MKNEKLIEFNDDFLTLHHYKEPLIKVKEGEGFGYMGALLSTRDGEYVQCHICGKLFKALHSHVRLAHHMSASEYKEKFQLARTNTLISENEREKMKERTLNWLKGMSEKERKEFRDRAKKRFKQYLKNIHRTRFTISLETKNIRGTCPQQLLEKIKECKESLGRIPSKFSFNQYYGSQRYTHLIYKNFGSWTNALKLLGMETSKKKANNKGKRYSSEELLEYLRLFFEETNKIPTITDFRKGLLPAYETYTNRFGTISRARTLANVPNIIR